MKSLLLLLTFLLTIGQLSAQLEAGQTAPDFTFTEGNDDMHSLSEFTEKGPVLLFFYRGEWCPVCKKHLSELQDSLSLLTDRGISVIAVTPEQPKYIQKMRKKTGASFLIAHDDGYKIMQTYGVNFEVTKENVPKYYSFTHNYAVKHNGNEDAELPVPATFLITPDNKIKWRHYDFDYHNRASVRDILQQL